MQVRERRSKRSAWLPVVLAAFAGVLAACRADPMRSSPVSALPAARPAPTGADPIKHVVIVVQENRSVDNLFQGFPGADTRPYGYDVTGKKIKLKPVGLDIQWDLAHSSTSFFAACDGQGSFPGTNCKMDGFDQEYWDCGHGGYPPCPNHNPPYSYVPRDETEPYFEMGDFTLKR